MKWFSDVHIFIVLVSDWIFLTELKKNKVSIPLLIGFLLLSIDFFFIWWLSFWRLPHISLLPSSRMASFILLSITGLLDVWYIYHVLSIKRLIPRNHAELCIWLLESTPEPIFMLSWKYSLLWVCHTIYLSPTDVCGTIACWFAWTVVIIRIYQLLWACYILTVFNRNATLFL